MTLAGHPVPLTAIEYRLLRRVWDAEHTGELRPMRTVIRTLRRRLGDYAQDPTYIFTEPRVGYRMAREETQRQERE